MYNNMLEELRSKEREAHLQEKKDFGNRIQNLYKKARADLQEDIVEKKQMDSGIVNTWEYKINSLVRAIKESYAKMQVGEFQFYNIISTYNDACIYLKNIVKYSSLNQSYKLQFDQDFRKVLPALQDIEFYAIQVKNIIEPAIQEMIKSIENKTYNTIGAELGVRTLKSGTLEKQLLINKIISLKEFIKKNKDKVSDRKDNKKLSDVNTALGTMKTKLSSNSVDWNRIEQQQKKIDEHKKFNDDFKVVDSIIQPLLDAEEKAQEEEKRKKAREEEADKLRRIQYEKERKQQKEEIDKLLKERKNIMDRMASPKKNSVLNLLNSLEERQKTGQENVMNQEQNKDPFSDLDISSLLQQEMNVAQNSSVNMPLNQANNDQREKEAPIILEGSTEPKQPPSITLQTGQLASNDDTIFEKLNSALKDDDEIGKLVVESMKFIRPSIEEQIKLVLDTIPQLKRFDSNSIIKSIQNRNIGEAFDKRYDKNNRSLLEQHAYIVGMSNPMGHHLYRDAINDIMREWKLQHGGISDDSNTFNQIFQESKKLVLENLHKCIQQAKDLSAVIKNTLVSDILKDIEQQDATKKVEGRNAKFIDERTTQLKKKLLQNSPWLLEVNKNTKWADFQTFANSKRKEGLNFDTSEKWKKFKEYYDKQ